MVAGSCGSRNVFLPILPHCFHLAGVCSNNCLAGALLQHSEVDKLIRTLRNRVKNNAEDSEEDDSSEDGEEEPDADVYQSDDE